jgi:hypothetical protein
MSLHITLCLSICIVVPHRRNQVVEVTKLENVIVACRQAYYLDFSDMVRHWDAETSKSLDGGLLDADLLVLESIRGKDIMILPHQLKRIPCYFGHYRLHQGLRVDFQQARKFLQVVPLVAGMLIYDEEVLLVQSADYEALVELADDLELEELSLFEIGLHHILFLLLKLVH